MEFGKHRFLCTNGRETLYDSELWRYGSTQVFNFIAYNMPKNGAIERLNPKEDKADSY
jgi:hypothetical protein